MVLAMVAMVVWVVQQRELTLRPTLEYIFAHTVAPQQLLNLAQLTHVALVEELMLLLLLLPPCSRWAC